MLEYLVFMPLSKSASFRTYLLDETGLEHFCKKQKDVLFLILKGWSAQISQKISVKLWTVLLSVKIKCKS